MKVKNLNPIERHVEKIALAVAVIAAGVMVYLGFWQPVATVTMPPNPDPIRPEQVEPTITSVVKTLSDGLDKHHDFITENLWKDYPKKYESMVREPINPKEDPQLLAQVPLFGPTQVPPGAVEGTNAANQQHPIAQPSVPSPEDPELTQDRGVAVIPAVGTKDKIWVKLSANYPILSLQSSFAGVDVPDDEKLPEQFQRIVFYRVEVQRQEKQADGVWSDWTDVPAVSSVTLPEVDLSQVKENDLGNLGLVLNQISDAYQAVLQPAFYQIQGPQQTISVPAVSAPKLTPQEIARQKAALQAAQKNAPRVTTPGPSGRGGRRGGERGSTPGAPSSGSPTGTPPGFPGNPGPPGGIPYQQPIIPMPNGSEGSPPPPQFVGPGGQPQPGQGNFDELLKQPSIPIWFYDESVKPEMEYRYRMRVLVYNPTFKLNLPLKEPKFKDIPWLPSSPWLVFPDSVKIDANMHFFIVGRGISRGLVGVRIYKWVSGRWAEVDEDIAPGLPVGHLDDAKLMDDKGHAVTQSVDFGTGYTLVDAMDDVNNSVTVVLETPDGRLIRRNSDQDSKDPQQDKLNKLISRQGQSAAAANTP